MNELSLRQLSEAGACLSEKIRIEIIYYVYTFGPTTEKQLILLTGATQAKVSRHLRYLKFNGMLKKEKHVEMEEIYSEFIRHFLAFLSPEDKGYLKVNYEKRSALVD